VIYQEGRYKPAFSYDRYGNMTCTQNQNTQGLCPQYTFSLTSPHPARSACHPLPGTGARVWG